MKLNNKGYAITIIIFGILVVFIIVLSSLLITMNNSVKLNKVVNEDVIENIQLSTDTSGSSLTERIEQLENNYATVEQNVINKIYPVGSIYISATDASIEDVVARFGGEWESYAQGRTLVGVGSTTDSNGNALVYDNNATGGSSLTSLNVSNLPSHSHSIPALSGTAVNTGSGYTLSYNTTGTNNASTGYQSANHTHGIPALSGTAQSSDIGPLTFYGAPSYLGNASGWAAIQGEAYFAHTAGTNAYYLHASGGAHAHTVITNASTTELNSVNHTHKYTNRYVTKISGVESHSHTVTTTESNTGSAGSGSSLSVQDPYITVYMYKRIK